LKTGVYVHDVKHHVTLAQKKHHVHSGLQIAVIWSIT